MSAQHGGPASPLSVSEPDGAQEARSKHAAAQGASAAALPETAGGPALAPRSDVDVRVERRLRRLGALFRQAAQILEGLAKDAEIQLAAPPNSRLMSIVQATNASAPDSQSPVPTTALPRALLGVNEMAELLAVDTATIRRWRRSGELPPAIEIGTTVRWRPETVAAWLREREVGS